MKVFTATAGLTWRIGERVRLVTGFHTTSADQVAGAMKAMTANSAKATTIYYVKGTNWAVMKSDDGQNMPTKSGTEAMQKKIGSGTVETVS